jgi:hypothetical protein
MYKNLMGCHDTLCPLILYGKRMDGADKRMLSTNHPIEEKIASKKKKIFKRFFKTRWFFFQSMKD